MFDARAAASPGSILAFASGGGQMGALLRSLEWSGTGLGPVDAWPPALRMAAGIMLGTGQPAFVAWGADLCLLFNDAYRAMLGARGSDPARILGQPFRQVWPEVWDIVGPMFEGALRGEPSRADDHPFLVQRNGYPEQIYVRFSATSLRDEAGLVSGVFCTCADTTDKVVSQRERDLALAQLAASKDTLEIVADAAEFGLFEHDVQSGVVTWSPRARAHFGLSPDAPVDAGTLGHARHAARGRALPRRVPCGRAGGAPRTRWPTRCARCSWPRRTARPCGARCRISSPMAASAAATSCSPRCAATTGASCSWPRPGST
ncbi:MAG: sensor hybrid histidine kinase [Massilia sp.]|nr:sensor hybrid histidine kinase [Massilia sp.]